ncbi:MAG TPA: SAM-dependent chlorinase/fluorinase [Candidatus Eisenbacteria bacterium]|nr:SAM-dependent chlorinase/fluorinase [Candidatus Eisenbacteria bacterium]
MARPPLVTFTTDFGSGSPLVAAMKAMVLAGCPHAVLVDVSHEVPRFDVSAGSFMLFAGTRHFPGGSVHLAVVDPGVGSSRRRLIVQAGGRFYIGPDNGLFAIVIDEVGLQRTIELAPRPHGAPTFEGRDVFAPAAAALASGVPLESLGPPTDPPMVLPDTGPRVLWVDGFGNLVTNLKPPARRMRIHNHDITATATTYSEGRPNEPFVYVGSMGYLEVAVRETRADKLLGARPGMKVELT